MAEQELATTKYHGIASKLDKSVMSVIGQQNINGFEKAYMVSVAATELREALTPEYMKPIMALQGNKLGFKADKIYDEATVKNCLIEAVLMGVQPVGNQFNIIAGNAYLTREGLGYLLANFQGLSYDIVPGLPKTDGGNSNIVMTVEWTLAGVTKTKALEIPIKVNNFMGSDAIIGKATRKARKWLYDTITGSEIPEGDVSDTFVDLKPNSAPVEEINVEDLQFLFDLKKDKLKPAVATRAQEIIDNKEVASYAKLHKTLSDL